MGFLDSAITLLGSVATGFLAGGPAGAAVAGVSALGGVGETGLTSGLGSLGTAGAGAIQTGTAAENLAASQRLALTGSSMITGVPTGFMKNITRTTVQTIAPDGSIVRTTVMKGSPYLMRSDFVILKRTLALIADAEERVPRPRTRGQKAAKEQAHTQGLLEGIVAAGNPTAALLTHHAHD